MATRYNLRNRAKAGLASQLQVHSERIAHPRPVPIIRDSPPHLEVPRTIPGPTIALYSDIVASRSLSPRVGAEAQLLAISPEDVGNERVNNHLADENLAYISTEGNNNRNVENITSSEVTSAPKGSEDGQWTTVKRRRVRSLSSIGRTHRINNSDNNGRQALTKEQVHVVQAATNELTNAQKQNYQRRHKAVARKNSTSPSRGEGPSEKKGKGIDPREWGNIGISLDEFDVKAQRAAFESLSKKRKTSRVKEKWYSKPRTHQPRLDDMSRVIQPAESRPVAQIAKDSYLGAALQNVRRHERRSQHRRTPSQPSDSGSSSSDSEDSDSGSSSDPGGWSTSQSEDLRHRHHKNKHGRNKHRRHVSSKSSNSSRSNIKPIPPLEYDGKADARAYH